MGGAPLAPKPASPGNAVVSETGAAPPLRTRAARNAGEPASEFAADQLLPAPSRVHASQPTGLCRAVFVAALSTLRAREGHTSTSEAQFEKCLGCRGDKTPCRLVMKERWREPPCTSESAESYTTINDAASRWAPMRQIFRVVG